jgi:uncharacterized OB-fold protein
MSCTKCGSELPPTVAYCPICGAPRSEWDRLAARAQTAAEKAVVVSAAALDRVSKEMEPAIGRIVNALQPAADEIGKTLRPVVEGAARVANEIADAVQPAAQETARAARSVGTKTMAAVRPAVARAAEQTQLTFQRIRERVRRP